jgi:hypothetical protein
MAGNASARDIDSYDATAAILEFPCGRTNSHRRSAQHFWMVRIYTNQTVQFFCNSERINFFKKNKKIFIRMSKNFEGPFFQKFFGKSQRRQESLAHGDAIENI